MAGERLVFDIFAIDNASRGFIAAGRSASAAADNVAGLARRLDEIGAKSAEARVGLKGNKEALAQIDQLQFRLLKLGEITSSPDISLEGFARASAQISALELQVDRLNKKAAEPKLSDLSFLERQFAARSGAGGIPFLGRLFRGGSDKGQGLPGVLGKIPAGIGNLPPAAAIAGLAAGLAALPFLAQAAAGGITLALGGGLAALGVAGALGTGKSVSPAMITAAQDRLHAAQLRQAVAQDKLNQLMASGSTNASKLATAQAAVASSSATVITAQGKLNQLLNDAQTPAQLAMRKAFMNLSNDAQTALATIGKSFQPVLLSFASTADAILLKMTPVIAAAVKAIAGPVQLIGDTLLKSFASPQVVTMLKQLGVAFAALLKAFAPSIPGIVTSIADGFTNLFRAVAKNPKAIADMATGLFHLVGILLDVLAWLTNVADYVEHHWKPVMLGIAGPILDHWHGLVNFFSVTLPGAFRSVVITALQTAAGIAGAFGHLPGFLGAPFRAARAAIEAELGKIDGSVARTTANTRTAFQLLNGLTANLYVYTNFVNIGTPPGGIFPTPTGLPPGVRPVGTQPGTGTQPGRHAAGTMSAAAGWAWVGEQGPELAYFRGGETVIPSQVARGYAGGTGRNRQLDELIGLVDEQNDLLSQLIGVSAGAPARTGAGIGAAIALGGRAATYRDLYP